MERIKQMCFFFPLTIEFRARYMELFKRGALEKTEVDLYCGSLGL